MSDSKIRFHRGRSASTLAVLIALACAAPAAFADDRGTLIQVRAERLANDGECPEAIELISNAPEPARSSAELLRLKGKCEIDIGRFDAAISSLAAAKAADPSLANVDLMIGIARYEVEDFDGASQALDAARAGDTDRQAELELYSGLVLLREGNTREAALALEKAHRLDADAVEPVASYYAALAWHSERERDRAQVALERVREKDPGGPWAKQASDALRVAGGETPWWAAASVGIEYDSNVVLRATGDTQRDDDDFRAVWGASGGYRILETENWSGGLIASYTGSAHFDHNDFDTHYPSSGLWLDRSIGDNTLLRFRYDFGYAWIDYDPFLARNQERVSLLHDWGVEGTTELFIEAEQNNFSYDQGDPNDPDCVTATGPTPCGPAGVNERKYRDRDGNGVRVGVEQRIPVGESSTTLRGGYLYTRYWSDGDEWDYDGHRVHLGVSSLLPLDLLFDAEGSYTYLPFQHPSSFPISPSLAGTFRNTDRKDHLWIATGSLEKLITEDLSVSARYRYVNSNSNSGFFEYDRHIVGAYVTVSLP